MRYVSTLILAPGTDLASLLHISDNKCNEIYVKGLDIGEEADEHSPSYSNDICKTICIRQLLGD
jgi:hypothetical protein